MFLKNTDKTTTKNMWEKNINNIAWTTNVRIFVCFFLLLLQCESVIANRIPVRASVCEKHAYTHTRAHRAPVYIGFSKITILCTYSLVQGGGGAVLISSVFHFGKKKRSSFQATTMDGFKALRQRHRSIDLCCRTNHRKWPIFCRQPLFLFFPFIWTDIFCHYHSTFIISSLWVIISCARTECKIEIWILR